MHSIRATRAGVGATSPDSKANLLAGAPSTSTRPNGALSAMQHAGRTRSVPTEEVQ
jgi:hypothetical protein